MTRNLNELTLASPNGNWYKVSSLDGSVLSSGNNGFEMYGLATVIPEPSSLILSAFGLIGLAVLGWRRKR